MPSVLVARLIGVAGFALGSTMVFRAEQIRSIGGFEAVQDYIADDYQLGARVTALGFRVEVARQVVETDLGAGTWGGVWRHQLRWARTIRVSRTGGYFGYVGNACHALGLGGTRGRGMADRGGDTRYPPGCGRACIGVRLGKRCASYPISG